jgi:hypothetical protein
VVSQGANDVVLDIDMLALLLAGLYEQRDLFHALQFCSLAEQLVLRDDITITTIEEDQPPTRDEAEGRGLVKEMLAGWQAAGVISYETINSTTTSYLRQQDPFAVKAPPPSDIQPENTIDADSNAFGSVVLQAGNALHAERLFERPASLMPLQLIFYEISANVRADHSVCDLTGHYSSLSSTVLAMRQKVRINPSAYVTVPLPPIGYEVFSQTRSFDNVFASALTVREEFTELRTRLRKLQQLLDDPSVSLRDKVRHRAKWKAAWESIHAKYGGTAEMKLASTSQAIYRMAPDIPGVVGLSPSSWVSLLTKIVEYAPELWGHWRLRALHRTFEHYVNSPDRELGQAISNLIGREIRNDEAAVIQEILDQMNQFRDIAVLTPLKE